MLKNSKNKDHYVFYGEHSCFSVLRNNSRKVFKIVCDENNFQIIKNRFPSYLNVTSVVNKKQLEKVARVEDKHQGIVITVGELVEKISLSGLTKELDKKNFSYGFMLDRVQDPHNIGAIIRSAKGFGASFIIVGKTDSPGMNATISRSSAGYSEEIPIYTETNLARSVSSLKKNGFWIVGLDGKSKNKNPREFFKNQSGKILFILGSEGHGMRDIIRSECDYMLKIPIHESVESLNVSNAAAIISYEIYQSGLVT